MAPRTPRQKKPKFDALKARKTVFGKRFPNIKKKCYELSVLCDISVALVCYDPDDTLHVWPEDNPEAVKQILTKFVGLTDEAREKHASHLTDFLPTISAKKMDAAIGADSSPDFEAFSCEQLLDVMSAIKSKLIHCKQIQDGAKYSEKKTIDDSPQQLTAVENNGVLDNATISDHVGCGQFGEISDFGVPTDDNWALIGSDDELWRALDAILEGVSEDDINLPELYQIPSAYKSDDIWEGISAEDPIVTKPNNKISELCAMEVTNIWEMEPLYMLDM